ncbi:hypothetical protein ACKKBG_A23775 [Auxenochlorella protothecoides x Auxenochlorella symbiontica]|uniref:Arp2/3 complex 41 kDa subunit n=1 Tax=Auxenochlorella protothecoides TaxID=3075 RepID=A0A087SL73_AUXPR|nr:Actin-related protein 2/3 complex subunit 1B [Auxenochlorella protothecoides]KFM26477.1 Actin-related protein 2/3 complex subunit 1B [Auxenochlorella protothecoides]RMZ56530.1 hypothetical protein APUTEX25_001377 [Auxenochlorella protothecoides]|eukprot:RMZ56530.1 hypothetical protein APUTEX25_001377 [Auxenochlorella protothecoides]
MSLRLVSSARLDASISAHAVSGDGKLLAVARENEISILDRASPSQNWTPVARVGPCQHSQRVSGLAWSGSQLASCSHDSGAVVWTRTPQGAWSPNLVVTRLARAALCVRWAPGGAALALGAVDGAVVVCHRDEERSLWAPRMLQRGDPQSAAAVQDLAWHPAGSCLASVAADGSLRIHATPCRGAGAPTPPSTTLGAFGTLLYTATPSPGAWAMSVAWDPSGSCMAVASSCGGGAPPRLTLIAGLLTGGGACTAEALREAGTRAQTLDLRGPCLGLTSLLFLTEDVLVGAGFHGRPLVFRRGADGPWAQDCDPGPQEDAGGAQQPAGSPTPARPATLAQRIRMFEVDENRSLNVQGRRVGAGGGKAAGVGPGRPSGPARGPEHASHIGSLAGLAQGAFTSAGADGQLLLWQVTGVR